MVGSIATPVFMILLLANGSLNSVFEELDLSAVFDAVEGAQMNAFLPALDFKMPPNINYFFSEVMAAVSVNPEEEIVGFAGETMADSILGEGLPDSEPLNDKLATIGYENTAPLAEIGTTSVILMM